MIYIDINRKTPPEDWCRRAAELTERLKALRSREERIDLIRRNENMWQELKVCLTKLSHGKCWYSEAKELVSDYHVDHFRPKSSAKQLDESERDGYWWLAFDWKNYRLAGSICNSLHHGTDGETYGKSNYFPVKDGSRIATTPECDLNDEIIYLLDPTNPYDPPLLTFDVDGQAIPATSKGTWQYDRASTTIKLLHLNYVALADERKKIWNKCTRLINEAEKIMYSQHDSASVTARETLKNIINDLLEMVSPESELSSTACACLLNSSMWARKLLLN